MNLYLWKQSSNLILITLLLCVGVSYWLMLTEMIKIVFSDIITPSVTWLNLHLIIKKKNQISDFIYLMECVNFLGKMTFLEHRKTWLLKCASLWFSLVHLWLQPSDWSRFNQLSWLLPVLSDWSEGIESSPFCILQLF